MLRLFLEHEMRVTVKVIFDKNVNIYTIFVVEIWGGVISSSNCFAKFSNICGVDGDEVTIIGTINSDTRPPPLLSIEHPP